MKHANSIRLADGERENQRQARAWQEPVPVLLHGREVQVTLTRRAWQAVDDLDRPLVVEMELYFSCLVRKQVLFKTLEEAQQPRADMALISGPLLLSFRPVVTQHCSMDELGATAPPVETMPMKYPGSFVPPWLQLDFRQGEWCGEFAYRP